MSRILSPLYNPYLKKDGGYYVCFIKLVINRYTFYTEKDEQYEELKEMITQLSNKVDQQQKYIEYST